MKSRCGLGAGNAVSQEGTYQTWYIVFTRLKSRGMASPSFLTPLNDFLKRSCQLSCSIIHSVYLFSNLCFHVKSFQ